MLNSKKTFQKFCFFFLCKINRPEIRPYLNNIPVFSAGFDKQSQIVRNEMKIL